METLLRACGVNRLTPYEPELDAIFTQSLGVPPPLRAPEAGDAGVSEVRPRQWRAGEVLCLLRGTDAERARRRGGSRAAPSAPAGPTRRGMLRPVGAEEAGVPGMARTRDGLDRHRRRVPRESEPHHGVRAMDGPVGEAGLGPKAAGYANREGDFVQRGSRRHEPGHRDRAVVRP